jgi:hypothetical protein
MCSPERAPEEAVDDGYMLVLMDGSFINFLFVG